MDTTLVLEPEPLVYGAGAAVGSGAPALNAVVHTHYFSGPRGHSNPGATRPNPRDGRLDAEGIRVSTNGRGVYISDEYGPYLYGFNRRTGERSHVFKLPAGFAVSQLERGSRNEIGGERPGASPTRAWRGWPSRRTARRWSAHAEPVGAGPRHGHRKNVRIVTIDIETGDTREYAYQLDTGQDGRERDPRHQRPRVPGGRARRQGLRGHRHSVAMMENSTGSIFAGAADVSGISGGANLSPKAVTKELFLTSSGAERERHRAFRHSRQDRGHRVRTGRRLGGRRSTRSTCRTTTTTRPSSRT